MHRSSLILLILALAASAAFAEEGYQLERIIVTPSRLTASSARNPRSLTVVTQDLMSSSTYRAIPDVIGNVGGVDIRRRGPEGVQADINIRGATFEENAVLLDGIKINDPQTGHYNMDLPLTSLDVDRIEVLKGPAASLYGPNSFGGVINIITKSGYDRRIIAEAEGGSYDYFLGRFSASHPLGFLNNRISFEESRSTGYMPETEFNILSLSDSLTADTGYGRYDFLFGYTKKDFGADSFYSNLYANEEEHTDTRFFKINGKVEMEALKIEPKLFLRRHRDKFALDRNRPGWQTNYHTTYDYGGEVNFVLENPFAGVAYGFELSQDTIDSTNLQQHRRTKEGMYLEISPRLSEKFYVNIGIREDRFTDFGWECSPSVNASYMIFEHLVLKSSVGRSYRVPTFTDLYYKDSANIGNSDLNPEHCWSYEAGLAYSIQGVDSSATFFRRDSYDTIDWTRSTARDPWRISNIGTVKTGGFEFSLNMAPKKFSDKIPVENIFLNYTALDQYRKHDYLSKYALDYLKQHIAFGISCDILGFKNSWTLNYKKRVGDSGYLVVDTRVSRDIVQKDKLTVKAFLDISNLFDVDYSEQSDIPMPGRWIKSGARIEF